MSVPRWTLSAAAAPRAVLGRRSGLPLAARLHEPHEDLLQPVHLVTHAEHFDAEAGQAGRRFR